METLGGAYRQGGLLRLSAVVGVSVLVVASVQRASAAETPESQRTAASFGSETFDNHRFFTPMTEGGIESGIEGWLRITAKGRRDYLQGIDPSRSALVVVDLYHGGNSGNFESSSWCQGLARHDEKLAKTWADRMDNTVTPNAAKLLKLFREKKMPVIYLSIGGIAQPSAYPSAIAPKPSDHKVAKFSSGAFSTSTLDNLLKEYGVTTIFFVGHDTAGCVSHTMAGAYDRNYQTILIRDACFSSVPELHDAAVKIWRYKGFVRTTEQVVADYPWNGWIDPQLKASVERTNSAKSQEDE